MNWIKVTKDPDKARALLRMGKEDMRVAESMDRAENPSSFTKLYYEAVKEIALAILISEGIKPADHKAMIECLQESRPELGKNTEFFEELRKLRNRMAYDGFRVKPVFVENNQERFKSLKLALLRLSKELE